MLVDLFAERNTQSVEGSLGEDEGLELNTS